MFTISQLTELLGWVSILNIGMLIFASIAVVTMKSTITSMHSKMFAIPEQKLALIYFKYLANYKMLSLIFIVAPYIALKIIGY